MVSITEKYNFQHYLYEVQQRVEKHLSTVMHPIPGHEKLRQAMHYALMGGGKRLRPFLTYAVADIYDVPQEEVDAVAAAIELIQCYSLVHDDLPGVDNAEMRRGKPSVWKQFDVPTALLAGDALLTLAFQVVAQEVYLGPTTRSEVIAMLAQNAGPQGMINGQMLDLFPEKPGNIEAIIHMKKLKTGCLIAASCQAGAIIAGASNAEIESLKEFGQLFGLIFQMTDDLLDVEGNTNDTGKPTAHDIGKDNLVNLLGVEEARKILSDLVENTIQLLENLPHNGGILQTLIPWVLNRKG